MVFLLCLLTRVLSEKELAKLHGEWMRLLPKQGGSCALFIHFEHSWQPARALMQRERERNRKWWCYISLFSPACFVELSLLPELLFPALPGQQGVGKGEAAGRWMEREVFALELHRIGEAFIRCQALPVSHFTLRPLCFLWSQWQSCQAIHQHWSLANRTERDDTSAVPTAAPPPLWIRGIAAPNPSTSLSSPIWLTSPASSAFQGAQEHGVQPPRNMAATHGTADGKIA